MDTKSTDRLSVALRVLTLIAIHKVAPDIYDIGRLKSFVGQRYAKRPIHQLALLVLNEEMPKHPDTDFPDMDGQSARI
jgi:hypothetical protein